MALSMSNCRTAWEQHCDWPDVFKLHPNPAVQEKGITLTAISAKLHMSAQDSAVNGLGFRSDTPLQQQPCFLAQQSQHAKAGDKCSKSFLGAFGVTPSCYGIGATILCGRAGIVPSRYNAIRFPPQHKPWSTRQTHKCRSD